MTNKKNLPEQMRQLVEFEWDTPSSPRCPNPVTAAVSSLGSMKHGNPLKIKKSDDTGAAPQSPPAGMASVSVFPGKTAGVKPSTPSGG